MQNTTAMSGLFLMAFAVMSCQVTMMVVFISGVESSPDIAIWLDFQLAMIAVATGVLVWCLRSLLRRERFVTGLRSWWRALPQWMLLAFCILFLMMALGELSFVLLYGLTGEADPWREHVPLICMTMCGLAFMALYCEWRAHKGLTADVSGRWR
ncbi:MAG: hypothetical protein AAAFM81_06570 [Pseudomonadota bacterium]